MPLCGFPMGISKFIPSMHPYSRRDDSARHHRETERPSVSRSPREIAMTESTVAIPSYGHRSSTLRRRSKSDAQSPAQQRIDAERDDPGKQTLSASKDQIPLDPREGEETKRRDELRSPRDDESHRMQVWRDAQHGMRYPPLKDEADIQRSLRAYTRSTESAAPASTHLLEVRARELSAVQHERDKILEEKKALEEELADIQHRYDERGKKLDSVRHERKAAQEQAAEMKVALEDLGVKSQEQAKKIDDLRHQRQSMCEQGQKLEQDYATLRHKYESQKQEHNVLSHKYQSAKASLEQRTSELQGIQKFISTINTYSGTEVVNMVRKLNEDVLQSTTYMAEWAVERFAFETSRVDEMVTETTEQMKVAEVLGARFMELLRTREHKDNPILVEMALRAYLIRTLHWIASPLSMGEDERSHGVYIEEIYQRMREVEGQAISGNWRALTRAYTLPAWISNHELAHAIDSAIVVGFSEILSAAGCTMPKADIASALGTKFADRIHQFVLLAGQVNKTIGVGIVSEDYEVVAMWPEMPFDGREMEDSYDSGERLQGAGRQDTVLCATELGLVQRMAGTPGSGEREKPSECLLIKPKVALISVLEDIN